MSYETQISDEARRWKHKQLRRPSFLERSSKKAQGKINQLIPQKVHNTITESIKKMVQATLVGSNITTQPKEIENLTFEERENVVKKSIETFKKTAAIEGASTGAGGIFLGLADFPLFLSIKMKFLFEVASIYGYSTRNTKNDYFFYMFFN